jgi:UbiD family decarboxylase
MAKNLQDFLARLEADHPEWMVRVKERVNPNAFEASCLLHLLEQRGERRAVVFDNVVDMEGRPTDFPLAYNLFMTREMCAYAMEMSPGQHKMELSAEFARRQEAGRGTVEVIDPARAPCRQVVLRGEEADLRRLPVAMHHRMDAGAYFTMTCAMKALSGNFTDVTFNKNMVTGPRRMSFSSHAHHHLDAIVGEYEKVGRRAPAIAILGHHPAFYMAACAMTPYGADDYASIAGFLQEPLRLTPSVTWGDALMVPADAEVIIEGEIPPGVRESQNPYGEIAGYYQEPMQMPVVEVTAITHRRGAVVQGVFPGRQDHWNLGGIPKEGSVFNAIRRNIPGVKALHLPPSGNGRFSCYISLHKAFDNEPRKAAMQAFVEMPNLKFCVVVDEDIDVFDEREVLWAMATRTWWDQDLEVVRQVQSFRGWLGSAVAMVDATRPRGRPFPQRNDLPADVLARLAPDLGRYFPWG